MIKGVAAVWLPVTNMERAVAFYGDTLGLAVTEHDNDWSEIDANGLKIGLNGSEPGARMATAAPSWRFSPTGRSTTWSSACARRAWNSRARSPSTRGAGSCRSRTPTATTCSCYEPPPG